MPPLHPQLARTVDLCTLRHNLQHGGELCSASQLAAALAVRGYSAHVTKAAGGGSGTAAFRNLRHTFVTVAAPALSSWPEAAEPEDAEAEALGCSTHLLVDPHFRCQFLVAGPTPRFAQLQRLLPQTFVGTLEQLEQVAEWVCSEMEWSFKTQAQPLPPWRELQAMLTKWRPQQAQPPAPAGVSPSTSPPAPCCCQHGGGGAAHGVATACCSTQRSPGSVLTTGGAGLQPSAALLACSSRGSSAPISPTCSQASDVEPLQAGRRTSLLSRSLEAVAELRRSGSMSPTTSHLPQPYWAGRADPYTPRVVVVRRSMS